jgi:Fic family protein
MDNRSADIIAFIKKQGEVTSKEVFEKAALPISFATVKRMLAQLLDDNILAKVGQGKATKYTISPAYELIYSIDLERYYEVEIDDRTIKSSFNFDLIPGVLSQCSVFTSKELAHLKLLQETYRSNIEQLSETERKKEMERLAIDLSWKSSQIEGNTYSLLETERLLKEKETAAGKSKEDAVMLLNHKEAIDFIIEHPDYLSPLTVSKIEDIHSILVKELGVDKNIRKRRVGISGTNYKPLDNEFQILEALEATCALVNSKEHVFEKTLLTLVLLSYIQPFADGNKRTARIVSNAILMSYGYCPISFRTADSIAYKKAMLLFYEQNNISAMKAIFIEQFEFAVNTYF